MTGAATTVLVSGCICKATSFEVLYARASDEGWGLDDIMRETGCGAQCGLCRPYLRRMLRTGQTAFTELLPPETPPQAERGDS